MQNELPEEIRKEIKRESVKKYPENSLIMDSRTVIAMRRAYKAGATAYALNAHEADLKYQIASNSNKLHAKKIDELAAENDRLRKAITDVLIRIPTNSPMAEGLNKALQREEGGKSERPVI